MSMVFDLQWILYTGAIGLIAIGLVGIIWSRHLFRIILSLAIAEAGANLMLVIAGYRLHGHAPIMVAGVWPEQMVDPVPQAMVLTAIVIGVGIQALALSLAIRVKEAYHSLDIDEIRAAMQADIDAQAGVTGDLSQEEPSGREVIGPTVAAEEGRS